MNNRPDRRPSQI